MSSAYPVSFTSKVNPVKPYKISTSMGDISIAEVNLGEELTPKLIKKINRFFCDNFSKDTKDEHYMKYRTGTLLERKLSEAEFEKHYSDIFNNSELRDNTTLLLAKDSKNKIQGACLSSPYYEVPQSNKNTLWIDSLAVNDMYRKEHIASELLNTTLNVNKNSFTDAFLTGTIFAKGFYKRLGFKPLDRRNKAQKTVYDYLKSKRYDIPKYVIPFTKPLQKDKPRWYEVCAGIINKSLTQLQ